MARPLCVAAARSGPIRKDEDRRSVVARLCAMMATAADQGCELVAFTELALTTFFPRYHAADRADMDHWFDTELPNDATRPLFDLARQRWVGLYLGYGELMSEGQHFNSAAPNITTGSPLSRGFSFTV